MAKKVLIVEDDNFLQGLASRKLQKDGLEVSIASNSTEAFKALEGGKIELILLDLLLPNVDGFEILKKIKADPATKGIEVIVFSSLSEEKDIKRAKDLGASEFMVKANFTLDELAEKVKSTLK